MWLGLSKFLPSQQLEDTKLVLMSRFCLPHRPLQGKETHMGNRTLDRIPPGHGVFGNVSVSRCGSMHGEFVLPPKLTPV